MKEKFAYLYDSLIKWIQLKQLGSSIGDRLKKKNVNIIAIYGANEFGQMVYKDVCNSVEVICYIDKKAKEMKTDAFDKGVIGLDELSGLPDRTASHICG